MAPDVRGRRPDLSRGHDGGETHQATGLFPSSHAAWRPLDALRIEALPGRADGLSIPLAACLLGWPGRWPGGRAVCPRPETAEPDQPPSEAAIEAGRKIAELLA
jgi:hypothetical protein